MSPTVMSQYYLLIIFTGRYFSVTIFCRIGLPGFTASLSFAAAGLLVMIATVLFIDKVSIN